jgi:hypothetical protein
MPNERLPVPPADLIPRDRVAGYPTDFKAMTQADLDLLGHCCICAERAPTSTLWP